ncbi:MAG: class B sortase [Oscillospiraceae bacterium]|nr:class B sortase [Oscillospiraceae bacterium]
MIDKMRTFARSFVLTGIVLALAAIAVCAGIRIAEILNSNQSAADTYEDIQSAFQVESTDDFPQIDWPVLKRQYPNVIAWLYCPDTKLNYPVLQATDNDFYLTHLADSTADRHGAIYMDYRNNAAFTDENILIYGHNMTDGTMFNCLLNWGNADYFAVHPELYLLTENGNYTVALYNVCVVDTESPVYDLACGGDKAVWMAACSRKSWVTADFTPSVDVPVITLSTCSNHSDRFILQGVLYKDLSQHY